MSSHTQTMTILKVTNRSSKKPIKRLPAEVEITDATTVQDVKKQLAKTAGGIDPNRLGIFDPEKKKILKDHKALISQQQEIMNGQEILIKDLGPQLGWRTVFIVEYFGPILIHALFPLLRSYIYTNAKPLSNSQLLSCGLIILHFLKREYETIFVHRFSLETMPAFNIFKNSFHYWVLGGVFLAYFAYSPNSYGAISSPAMTYLDIAGTALFVFGESANLYTHNVLSNLRKPGETTRGIPKGFGFGLVTCPNYMFETMAWVGMILTTKSLATVIFTITGIYYMLTWAIGKEKRYRADFGDKYKKHKFVMFPGIA